MQAFLKKSSAKNFRFAPLAVAPCEGVVSFGVADVCAVAVPLSGTSNLLLYSVVTMPTHGIVTRGDLREVSGGSFF